MACSKYNALRAAALVGGQQVVRSGRSSFYGALSVGHLLQLVLLVVAERVLLLYFLRPVLVLLYLARLVGGRHTLVEARPGLLVRFHESRREAAQAKPGHLQSLDYGR